MQRGGAGLRGEGGPGRLNERACFAVLCVLAGGRTAASLTPPPAKAGSQRRAAQAPHRYRSERVHPVIKPAFDGAAHA